MQDESSPNEWAKFQEFVRKSNKRPRIKTGYKPVFNRARHEQLKRELGK